MTVLVTQRIGPNSRLVHYKEVTRGSDGGITAGTVIPLRGDQEAGYEVAGPEAEVPLGNGTIQGGGSAPQAFTAGGSVPSWLDFNYSGYPLQMPVGSAGYLRAALVTGSEHLFWPSAATAPVALSAQFQAEFRESSAVQWRTRYNLLRSLAIAYAQGGAAPLDLDFLGCGDFTLSDLAGTKTDNGVVATSVYNGYARLAVAALAPTWFPIAPTDFRVNWETGSALQPGSFQRSAVSVNQGVPMLRGVHGLAMEVGGASPGGDFNFSTYALNRTIMSYECLWADQAVDATPYPSAWLELNVASLRYGLRLPKPGGRNGKTTVLDWFHILDNTLSKISARCFGAVVGPYAITVGVNDKFPAKVDGLATVTTTLTPGVARTATQIVTDLNANGAFSAIALAEVFNGRVRFISKQTVGAGSASSCQFDTTVANHCGAALGFNNTSRLGMDAPYAWRLYNARNADY